jgi:hypothetical protein
MCGVDDDVVGGCCCCGGVGDTNADMAWVLGDGRAPAKRKSFDECLRERCWFRSRTDAADGRRPGLSKCVDAAGEGSIPAPPPTLPGACDMRFMSSEGPPARARDMTVPVLLRDHRGSSPMSLL